MKKLLGLVVFMLLFSLVAQSETIYLIRHAEKASDGSKDPALTVQGRLRADNIAAMLSEAGITQVYATDYQRTQLTAKPLADYLGIEVISYDPSQLPEFAKSIQAQSQNVLIVGHSNTTPELTHLFSGKPLFHLKESDFDFIFQVVIDGPHKALNVLKSLPVQGPE